MAHPAHEMMRTGQPRWARDVGSSYAEGGAVQPRDWQGRFSRLLSAPIRYIAGKAHEAQRKMGSDKNPPTTHLGIRG